MLLSGATDSPCLDRFMLPLLALGRVSRGDDLNHTRCLAAGLGAIHLSKSPGLSDNINAGISEGPLRFFLTSKREGGGRIKRGVCDLLAAHNYCGWLQMLLLCKHKCTLAYTRLFASS